MKITSILLMLISISGCSAVFKESYFLSAYDPNTKSRNYYKIDLKGDSFLSSTKFSVGFYDKAAIERLFGEFTVKDEYYAEKIKYIDPSSGYNISDISQLLKDANRETDIRIKSDKINQSIDSVNYLFGNIKSYLLCKNELQKFSPILCESELILRNASDKLSETIGQSTDKKKDLLNQASALVQKAFAQLNYLKMEIDPNTVVNFFDGAGNQIDVSNKTMVIFVASDINRFSSAIRELSEADNTTNDVMKVVFGEKIMRLNKANNDISRQSKYLLSLSNRLDAVNVSLSNLKTQIVGELDPAKKILLI